MKGSHERELIHRSADGRNPARWPTKGRSPKLPGGTVRKPSRRSGCCASLGAKDAFRVMRLRNLHWKNPADEDTGRAGLRNRCDGGDRRNKMQLMAFARARDLPAHRAWALFSGAWSGSSFESICSAMMDLCSADSICSARFIEVLLQLDQSARHATSAVHQHWTGSCFPLTGQMCDPPEHFQGCHRAMALT